MAKRRKSRRIVINAPKYYHPGKGRPREELVYISPREKRGLLASTDFVAEMTKHGILSFADDSANHPGESGGNPGYSGGNFGNTGALGGQMGTGRSSTAASRSSATGNTSRASQSSIGGSQTGSSGSSSSTSHASSSNRSSSSGPSTSSGSGSARSGAAGMNAGQGPATSSGGRQASPPGTPGGGGGQPARGALDQAARGTAPSPSFTGGVAPRAPGSAMGLLGATAKPKSITDRIGPERPEDRDPLSSQGRVVGSYMDPMNPVGLPARNKAYDPLGGILSPSVKAKKGFVSEVGDVEGTIEPETRNPYDKVFNDGTIKYKGRPELTKVLEPIKPTETTIQEALDWQKRNKYKDPKLEKLQSPVIGIMQAKPKTLAAAAANLGLDPYTTKLTPEVQDDLTMEIARMPGPGIRSWAGADTPEERERLQAAYDVASAFPENAPKTPNFSPNYNDPVATAGLDLPKGNMQRPSEPGMLGTIPGDSPFAGGRLFGDPVEDRGPIINPAGGIPKTTDRVPQDLNYNPSQGVYNPSTGRVDYSPEQRARINEGQRLLGGSLNDLPGTNYPGLLGNFAPGLPDPKMADRIPSSTTGVLSPPTRSPLSALAPSTTGILSPSTRSRLPASRQPAPEEETNNFMPEVLTRPPVGLPQPPIPRNKPQLGPVPETAATTRHRYNAMKALEEPAVPQAPPIPREKPERVIAEKPYEAVDTTSKKPSVDVTEAILGTPNPYGDETVNAPEQPVAITEPTDPDAPINVRPDIPVAVTIKNNVIKQYGPDEGGQILETVAAVKNAMRDIGTVNMGGFQGRRRGIGQLAMAPKRRRSPTSVIPRGAPLLEA